MKKKAEFALCTWSCYIIHHRHHHEIKDATVSEHFVISSEQFVFQELETSDVCNLNVLRIKKCNLNLLRIENCKLLLLRIKKV